MRTRFAPSPTGFLHIGGARTALFSWLYARKHGGQFILRIEDTDLERSEQRFVDAIIDGMNWLGLDHDEDLAYQMQRMDRYKALIQQLLDEGKAYRCYCSKERLEVLREQQMKAQVKPRYDGHCRNLQSEDVTTPHVIRFKNPTTGSVCFDDLVRGSIEIQNSELDDLIIQRSDGSPTYNFCVVIDDWDMNVSTVIRGDDHINNTPRQINIYHALGVAPPQFAHVPMILGEDGKRLSKRHGAVSVTEYREQGYLPEALLNYLVRLGWSHGDQEIFSKEEMISLFDVKDVNRAPAAFNSEKLIWMNQHYLKTENPDYIASHLIAFLQKHIPTTIIDAKLLGVIEALRERSDTLVDMAEKAVCFYQSPTSYDEQAVAKFIKPETGKILEKVSDTLTNLTDWSVDSLKQTIKTLMKDLQLKMPHLAQPLRIALTGNTQSPSIDLTLYLIGRERVLKDINALMITIK